MSIKKTTNPDGYSGQGAREFSDTMRRANRSRVGRIADKVVSAGKKVVRYGKSKIENAKRSPRYKF